ncbi:MAG: DNA gyrase/topoisomerase IV subunit A [Bacteroidales bacterium]|nr:DNA gyrase/topoisomerase IV subunit A [Bacteroidales bacterium]
MSDERDEILQDEELTQPEELEEQVAEAETGEDAGDDGAESAGEGDASGAQSHASRKEAKFSRVLSGGENRYKLPGMYKDWFLDYASYVMLDRAVPYIEDGFKPVQRRIMHTLRLNEDGKYHKVAGLVGDTMKFHPHGDASIYDAMVSIQQKELLIDGQGNWGNILTGDKAAAPRYIEARLSKFALEVVYNKKITEWVYTYDRNNLEPVCLPVKFPLLLAQGTKGIGVGLRVDILPHNFNELLDASIAALRGKEVDIYPDFQTGGIADCSKYNGGQRGGRVRVRATITKRDKRTLVIEDIPYGETTGSVIESIIKANDSGKIKIRKVDDYSAEKAEIVIQLAPDISPDKTIDALYVCTKCAVSLSTCAVVIKDGRPEFMSVNEILKYSAFHTRDLFERELNVQLGELEDDWHKISLEKIFFEKKIYRVLENDAATWEEQVSDVTAAMKKYEKLVKREITDDDILMLVEKPVRKISKFDIKAADEKIANIEQQMADIRYHLENLTDYTIEHFKNLKKKYGAAFPRRTRLEEFETIQAQKVVVANSKLYCSREEGFVGTDPKKMGNPEFMCDCSDIDDIIVFLKNGDYIVTGVKDKEFIGNDIIYAGVFKKGDERTIYNVIYRDGKGGPYYVKRFAVTGVTRNKTYNLTQGTAGSRIEWFTANSNGEAESVRISFRNRPGIRKTTDTYDFANLAIKGRSSRGNLLTRNPIARVQLRSLGVSTIGGKEIWFDEDIQRLNDQGRGVSLGEFQQDDKILVVLKGGSYYTTSFDLSNRYQGDIIRIEKLDPERVYSVAYWDKESKYFYIKRFSFEVSDNKEQSFISEAPGSKFIDICCDTYPRLEVTFKGKKADKEPEIIDVAEYIGKKGFKAKGRRVGDAFVGKVTFIEPFPEPELTTEEEPEDDAIELLENGGETPASENVSQEEAIRILESNSATAEDDSDDDDGDDGPIELTLF